MSRFFEQMIKTIFFASASCFFSFGFESLREDRNVGSDVTARCPDGDAPGGKRAQENHPSRERFFVPPAASRGKRFAKSFRRKAGRFRKHFAAIPTSRAEPHAVRLAVPALQTAGLRASPCYGARGCRGRRKPPAKAHDSQTSRGPGPATAGLRASPCCGAAGCKGGTVTDLRDKNVPRSSAGY